VTPFILRQAPNPLDSLTFVKGVVGETGRMILAHMKT
jgi:hypothetical protein